MKAIQDRVRLVLKRNWITPVSLCAVTGLIGELSGFALFILLYREPEIGWKYLLILGLTALLSFFFEYLRGEIEGHDETRFSPTGFFTTLIMLTMFELFAAALESAASISTDSLQFLGVAIIGPDFWTMGGNPGFNLMAMTGLWLVTGIIVAASLGWLIPRFAAETQRASLAVQRNRLRRMMSGAFWGGVAAAIAGSICVLLYIAANRLSTEFSWITRSPGEWFDYVKIIRDRIQWDSFAVTVKLTLAGLAAFGHFNGQRGPLFAVGVIGVSLLLLARSSRRVPALLRAFVALNIIAAATLAFGIPLAGPSVTAGLEELGSLMILVVLAWALPGAILGATVASLEQPSRNRRIWGFISFGVAIVLVVYSQEKRFALSVAAGLLFIGVFLLSRISIERYWQLLAFSAAIAAVGCTEIVNQATFINIQSQSLTFINSPLGIAARESLSGDLLQATNSISEPVDRIPIPKPGDPGDVLVDTTQALLKYRDRANKLASGANKAAAIQQGTPVLLTRILFGGDADPFFLDEMHIDHMGELTVANVLLEPPEERARIRSFITRLNGEMAYTQDAIRQAKENESVRAHTGDQKKIADLQAAEASVSESLVSLESARRNFETQDNYVQSVALKAGRHLPEWRKELIEKFELCLNGSLGFWVTIGLLAGWSVQKKHGKQKHH